MYLAIVRASVAFLFLAVHLASAQTIEEAAKLRQQARQLYQQARYADAEPFYKRSLAIREKALGTEHPDVGVALNDLATLYLQQGRSADAEPLIKRSLAITEKALGAVHPQVATALNNLAALYYQEGRYADAEPLFKRSLAITEKALGAVHPDVGQSITNLATLYHAQGRYADAEPLFKRSLAITEKALGAVHPQVATTLNNLAALYEEQGRYRDAELLYKRSLAIREIAIGTVHPDVANTLNCLADLYREQGRYADAEPFYKRSLAIREKALGPGHPDVANTLKGLADLYLNQGRFGDAEPLYKRSLAITEKALGAVHRNVANTLKGLADLYLKQGRYGDAEPLYKRSLAITEKALGAEHPNVATLLYDLSVLYQAQASYGDAEPLYKRSLAIFEKAFGAESSHVAGPLNGLAQLYEAQGRYGDAEPLFKRSLAITEKAFGAEHPQVATALNNLAVLYDHQVRYTDAEPLYERSLAISEKAFGAEHPQVATSLNNLATLYVLRGRYDEAEPLYKRSLAISEKAFGAEHPDVAESLNDLAEMYLLQKRYSDALIIVRRVISLKQSRTSNAFAILVGSQKENLINDNQAFADGFNVLQVSSSSGAADSIGKLAQRFAAGSSDLAALIRSNQDLAVEGDQADKVLVAAFSKSANERNAAQEAQLRKRLADIGSERERIQATLSQKFPDYAALAKPDPVSKEDTQKLLGDDEAVVAFYTGTKSYVWVVTKTDAFWTEIPVSAKMLGDEVSQLRESLTFAVDKPFDAVLAHKVYQKIFGPIADKLKGKQRLSILADGALTSLSFDLLITEDPAGKKLKDMEWMVKSYSSTVIPSIFSLKTMRAQFAQSKASKPMIGFADPVFSKESQAQARGNPKVAMRGLADFYMGAQLNMDALAKALPQLPSTRQEVLAVAKSVKASESDVKLGLAATETAVKQVQLNQYRIVYFATHGLVSGELSKFTKAKAEPALAFTFPDKPSELDDGLLQASEIAQLKLDADWVVLSACNTASSNGVGAEPLSGLARAFLYAGARSLVVSNWDVSDDGTAALMTQLFEISTKHPELSHGQALQRAELKLLADAKDEEQAHPRYWAPFVVVGEPAIGK